MKPLATFASRLGARIELNSEFIVENAQRYYLLNPTLRKVTKTDFFYAGLYLGKVKNGMFFPSFNFLNMLVPVATNKIILDRKAAWLFICGRDVFKKGILKLMGSQRRGDITLVMNDFGECLGFGMVAGYSEQTVKRIAVRNVLDVGDFLRREF
jgi:ribosome biogenesis protein Nip4